MVYQLDKNNKISIKTLHLYIKKFGSKTIM